MNDASTDQTQQANDGTDADVKDNGAESLTKDQERITQWQAAAEAAPTYADMSKVRADIAEGQAALDAMHETYQEMAAQRATVFGWSKVAEEEDVSPKMLHNWHRQHAKDAPDLSTVPGKEMAREQRRIDAANRRLEADAELRARTEAQQARVREAMKGWK